MAATSDGGGRKGSRSSTAAQPPSGSLVEASGSAEHGVTRRIARAIASRMQGLRSVIFVREIARGGGFDRRRGGGGGDLGRSSRSEDGLRKSPKAWNRWPRDG